MIWINLPWLTVLQFLWLAIFLKNCGANEQMTEPQIKPCKCSANRGIFDILDETDEAGEGCMGTVKIDRFSHTKQLSSPGEVHIKYTLHVDEELVNPQLLLTVSKFHFVLPCSSSGYGSCTYSLCGFQQYDLERHICEAWDCKCPIKKGVYHMTKMSIEIPDLGRFKEAAYVGTTDLQAQLVDNRNALFCGSINVALTRPDQKNLNDM